MMYAIHATVEIADGSWRQVRYIPTFYLHSHVQGITDETHAAKIARDILTSGIDDNADRTWHITAYEWREVEI